MWRLWRRKPFDESNESFNDVIQYGERELQHNVDALVSCPENTDFPDANPSCRALARAQVAIHRQDTGRITGDRRREHAYLEDPRLYLTGA
jgi:hypothetical protein